MSTFALTIPFSQEVLTLIDAGKVKAEYLPHTVAFSRLFHQEQHSPHYPHKELSPQEVAVANIFAPDEIHLVTRQTDAKLHDIFSRACQSTGRIKNLRPRLILLKSDLPQIKTVLLKENPCGSIFISKALVDGLNENQLKTILTQEVESISHSPPSFGSFLLRHAIEAISMALKFNKPQLFNTDAANLLVSFVEGQALVEQFASRWNELEQSIATCLSKGVKQVSPAEIISSLKRHKLDTTFVTRTNQTNAPHSTRKA